MRVSVAASSHIFHETKFRFRIFRIGIFPVTRPKVAFSTFLWSLLRFDLDETFFFHICLYHEMNLLYFWAPAKKKIVSQPNAHRFACIEHTKRHAYQLKHSPEKKNEKNERTNKRATRFRFMMNIHQSSTFIQSTVWWWYGACVLVALQLCCL